MARLFMDLVITFTGPALSSEGRAELRQINRDARQVARRAMVRVRKVVRSATPRRSGKLARSLNVRNVRPRGRGGIGVRLETGRRAFYAAPSNTGKNAGPNVGWWDKTTQSALLEETAGQLGQDIYSLGRRFAALVARDVIQKFIGRRLEGTIRILGAQVRSVPARGGAGRTGSINFSYGDE